MKKLLRKLNPTKGENQVNSVDMAIIGFLMGIFVCVVFIISLRRLKKIGGFKK